MAGPNAFALPPPFATSPRPAGPDPFALAADLLDPPPPNPQPLSPLAFAEKRSPGPGKRARHPQLIEQAGLDRANNARPPRPPPRPPHHRRRPRRRLRRPPRPRRPRHPRRLRPRGLRRPRLPPQRSRQPVGPRTPPPRLAASLRRETWTPKTSGPYSERMSRAARPWRAAKSASWPARMMRVSGWVPRYQAAEQRENSVFPWRMLTARMSRPAELTESRHACSISSRWRARFHWPRLRFSANAMG